MGSRRFTTPERQQIGGDAHLMSPPSVMRKHSVSRSQMYEFKRRYAKGSPMRTKKARGPRPLLSESDMAKLDTIARRNKRATLQKVTNLFSSRVKPASPSTIRRRLQDLGRNAYLAKRKPLLKPEHLRAHRRWVRETAHRNMHTVMWTDEAQMCTNPKGQVWVRCLRSERYQNDTLAPRFAKEHTFMVWAAIWHGGRTPLIRLDLSQSRSKGGGFNSDLYIEQVLRPVLKPAYDRLRRSWRGYGRSPVVMEDNSRIHLAEKCEAERMRLGIPTIFHPPNSPDLNPIEHVWAELKRRIRNLETRPRSEEELWEACQKVWEEIPINFINKVVHSMYYRRRAVQRARGGATRW